MKYVSLIRHAEAEHAGASQRDIDRSLTAHGQQEARKTANALQKINLKVDHIICSTAQRTRETAALLQDEIDTLPEPVWSKAAYLAQAEMLKVLLHNTPVTAEHVVLIGHNPGIEELVNSFCQPNRSRVHHFMATGTLAHLHMQISEWNQLDWGCGELIAFVPPNR